MRAWPKLGRIERVQVFDTWGHVKSKADRARDGGEPRKLADAIGWVPSWPSAFEAVDYGRVVVLFSPTSSPLEPFRRYQAAAAGLSHVDTREKRARDYLDKVSSAPPLEVHDLWAPVWVRCEVRHSVEMTTEAFAAAEMTREKAGAEQLDVKFGNDRDQTVTVAMRHFVDVPMAEPLCVVDAAGEVLATCDSIDGRKPATWADLWEFASAYPADVRATLAGEIRDKRDATGRGDKVQSRLQAKARALGRVLVWQADYVRLEDQPIGAPDGTWRMTGSSGFGVGRVSTTADACGVQVMPVVWDQTRTMSGELLPLVPVVQGVDEG